jgi:hypothetical protein
MGAEEFEHAARGKTMSDAFDSAVSDAQYAYGHSGYTGTIAEKDGYIDFGVLPDACTPSDLMDWIYDSCPETESPLGKTFGDLAGAINATFNDKWGAACGFTIGPDKYLFTGLASS